MKISGARKLLLVSCIPVALLLCLASSASAQNPPRKNAEGQPAAKRNPEGLFTRIYRLSDLVVPAPNYSFEGIDIQGLFGNDKNTGMGAGGLGGMGSGMGGGMGGGGFMNQPDDVQVDPQTTLLAQAGAGGGYEGGSAAYGSGYGAPGMSAYPGAMGTGMGMGAGTVGNPSHRFTLNDVAVAITTAIQPQTWREMGGAGTIVQLGGSLVVTQTAEVQEQVGQFLEALRAVSGAVRTITIRAYWLPITGEVAQKLISGENGTQLDIKTVAKLAGSPGAYHGQITCFDGQTVHIVSVRMKNFITSFIQVVGQTEPEATELLGRTQSATPFRFVQLGGGEAQRGGLGGVAGQGMEQFGSTDVGYQPVTTTIFAGALLQVTPTLTEDSKSIVLDLRSIVSEPSQTKGAVQFQKNMPIDRLSVAAQRLMTTLQIPLNAPTVVGGMGVQARNDKRAAEGDEPAEADSLQIYLVVQASLNE